VPVAARRGADLRAESTCPTCHRFHQSTFGLMRAAKAAAQ
jgi:hypothetical protein